MFDQRLQVLLTTEQRERLESEARQRNASVASLIRDAIDARYGIPTREERIRAVEEIRRMEAGPLLSPEELNRIVEEEREEALDSLPGLRER